MSYVHGLSSSLVRSTGFINKISLGSSEPKLKAGTFEFNNRPLSKLEYMCYKA